MRNLFRVSYSINEEGKKVAGKVTVPPKFPCDEEGHYWEERGDFKGQKFYMPAPVWAGNINFYLFEGPNIFIESHRKPLCDVPEMRAGGKVTDDGNLIMTVEEKDELLKTDPQAKAFLRPYIMGKDFLYRTYRWCLWLVGAEPADIRKCPRVLERIARVQEFRRNSKKAATNKKADTPMLFDEIVEPKGDYIAIPVVSSEKRKYIPMEWVSRDVVPGPNIRFLDNANLYQFGVMMSSVHNAWARVIGGRLRNDYRYANTVNYNAFPWPKIRREIPWLPGGVHPHYTAIEKTAQAILDARKLYPRSTLADLYDERTMPPELRKAHNANDEAVMKAYGFERHYKDDRMHDEDITINLMYMYQELTGCQEFYESYPNLKHWESFYGKYPDGDDEGYNDNEGDEDE